MDTALRWWQTANQNLDVTLMWLQIAVGFTGALTLVFLIRMLYRKVATGN